MAKIKRAIISVSDKKGIVDFAKGLSKYKVSILSTGGTAQSLRDSDITVEDVSHYTGFPEMLDGRVKTLHPKIHGGLLLNPFNTEHKRYLDANSIESFDMVVSNLYPFERVVEQGANMMEAVENIDIGGPTMTRSAAKAALLYGHVTIVTEPSQYEELIDILREDKGVIPDRVNRELALQAFKRTARYDKTIQNYLEEQL